MRPPKRRKLDTKECQEVQIDVKKNSAVECGSSNPLDIKPKPEICDTSNPCQIPETILDQIALEGLGGVNLNRLWILIDDVIPSLNCCKNAKSKEFVWFIINRFMNSPYNCIEAFYLDNKLAKSKSNQLIHPIQDNDILGSCEHYEEHVNITQEIKELNETKKRIVTLQELHRAYNLSNIFFVASQSSRFKAITPNWADPNVDLKLREYCILEAIGKSRNEGQVFPNNKSLGRIRIMLQAKKLITVYQEESSSPIKHFLSRFTPTCMRPRQEVASSMSKYLLSLPEHRCTLLDFSVRSNVSLELLRRRFFPAFLDYFYVYTPEDIDSKEGKLLYVKLTKPYVGIKEEPVNTAVDANPANADEYKPNSLFIPSRLCYHPGKLKSDRGILAMVYQQIAKAPNGISELDLRNRLNLPKFHLRNHLKNLIAINFVCSAAPTHRSRDNPFRNYKVAHKISNISFFEEDFDLDRAEIEDLIMELFRTHQVISQTSFILEKVREKKSDITENQLDEILKHLVLQGRLRLLTEVVHSVYRKKLLHIYSLRSIHKKDKIVSEHIKELKKTLFLEDRKKHTGKIQLTKLLKRKGKLRQQRKLARASKHKKLSHELQVKSSNDVASMQPITTSSVLRRKKKLSFMRSASSKKVRFDAIDMRAKSMIGLKRSTFSSAEDMFLILCRIVSILLEPDLQPSWCVHRSLVRNLLHKMLKRARDKTADACLRRIKYLTKLPTNIMSINELTLELRDDPDIAELTRQDRDIADGRAWNTLFVEVLNLVNARLPTLLGCDDDNIDFCRESNSNDYDDFLYCDAYSEFDSSSKADQQMLMFKALPLRFNQNMFMLNSLIELAEPINDTQLCKITTSLTESNELKQVAILASVCTNVEFNLNLKLTIPDAVVRIDKEDNMLNWQQLRAQSLDKLGDCLVVQPCELEYCCLQSRTTLGLPNFTSNELNKLLIPTTANQSSQTTTSLAATNKLIKFIGTILARIIVHPGIRRKSLCDKMKNNQLIDRIDEILKFMCKINLISEIDEPIYDQKPCMFGWLKTSNDVKCKSKSTVFEPNKGAFLQYCRLLNYKSAPV